MTPQGARLICLSFSFHVDTNYRPRTAFAGVVSRSRRRRPWWYFAAQPRWQLSALNFQRLHSVLVSPTLPDDTAAANLHQPSQASRMNIISWPSHNLWLGISVLLFRPPTLRCTICPGPGPRRASSWWGCFIAAITRISCRSRRGRWWWWWR